MPIFENEIVWGRCPEWKADVADFLLDVILAEVHPCLIYQKISITEVKLGNDLFVVGEELEDVLPGYDDVVEDFVGRAADGFVLDFEDLGWELPDEVVVDDAWGGVMAQVHVRLLIVVVSSTPSLGSHVRQWLLRQSRML